MIDHLKELREANQRAIKTREALSVIEVTIAQKKTRERKSQFNSNQIHQALIRISEPLANSYVQIKSDIQDTSRTSWAGTAHEIREILRGILEILAPDAEVEAQPGYQIEKGTSGPTQKQKVIYILKKYNAGSKEEEVVKQAISIEDRVGNLVRAMYSRASNAAHTLKDRREVIRILNYFEAIAHDLLNVE